MTALSYGALACEVTDVKVSVGIVCFSYLKEEERKKYCCNYFKNTFFFNFRHNWFVWGRGQEVSFDVAVKIQTREAGRRLVAELLNWEKSFDSLSVYTINLQKAFDSSQNCHLN